MGGDRLIPKVALQVLREDADVLIPLLGRFSQCAREDHVQVPQSEARRLDFDERPHHLTRRPGSFGRRVSPREQEVEENPQGVDIGRRSDALAPQLLRRGESRREHACPVHRQGAAGRVVAIVEELGDAEVEQLHRPVARDQDVAGLDVAVYDQIGVRVAHGAQHLEEQPHALLDGQGVVLRVDIDRLSINVFQHEVRLTVGGHARVEEPRDPRVGEPGQHRPLAAESFLAEGTQAGQVEELDRRSSLESSVGAPREPHRAHPALPNGSLKRVRTDPDPRHFQIERLGQEATAVGRCVGGQQGGDFGGDRRRFGAQLREPRRPVVVGQVERVVEQWPENLPPAVVQKGQRRESREVNGRRTGRYIRKRKLRT